MGSRFGTPAAFPGRYKYIYGLFEIPMDPIGPPIALESLLIRFESNTMVLTNVATFGVVVGATVYSFEVTVEDRYKQHIF